MTLIPSWTASSSRASAVPLAGFRILFGLCLVFDVAGLIEYRSMWFDDIPWVERGPGWVLPVLCVWFVATIGLTLGAFTRACAVINYCMCVAFMSFQAMPRSYEYHLDNLYIVTSFALPFLPIGRALSVDSWRRPPREKGIGPGSEIFFALVVSSIYLDSALWKLSSSMWMAGLGYWTTVVQPWYGQPSIGWTLEHEWIARGAGYITLVFELVFVLLIWFRRLRWPLLAIGFALHIGIGTLLPIPLFGLIMCSFLVALIPMRAPAADPAPAPESSPPFWRRLVPVYFATWALMFTLGAFDPVRVIASEGFGGSSTQSHRFWYSEGETRAQRLYAAGMFWSYRFFGWRTHPIFIDNQFSLYECETRMRFHPDSALDGADPFEVESEGEAFYPPHRNRRFLAWYYRSVWPLLERDYVETRITRYIDYYTGAGHLDPQAGWVTIEQRPLEMPVDRWRAGQRDRNLAQPWRRVGIARGAPGALEFEWREPCWEDSTP